MRKINAKQANLTAKEARFAEEYLTDLDATKAAKRAGYAEKSAASMGHELLRKPRVAAAIQAKMKARSERTAINADWLLARLALEADADIADLYDEQGALKPAHQWPMAWRKGLVAGVEVEEKFQYEGKGKAKKLVHVGTLRKVKIADRAKRLELIGRHVDVQAFKDRIAADVTPPLERLLKELAGTAIRPAEQAQAASDPPAAIRPQEA